MNINKQELDQLADDLILGTCIRGTHRRQDLIPSFLSLLSLVDDATHTGYMVAPFGPIPAYAMEDDKSPWWDSEEAESLLQELFDALDGASPEGYYFGAHPGDGSDFGYWEVSE